MGRPAVEMTGSVFGRLTIVKRHADDVNTKEAKWECLCECGKTHIASGQKLRRGDIQSCGCLLKDLKTTHGLAETAEYRIWRHVKGRTRSETNNNYQQYGGRGITMSDEWFDSFETFYKDMGPRPSEDHSIEREDNDKGYFKGNCKWATKTEQANNRRSSVFYTYQGKTQTLPNWCRELNLDLELVACRIYQAKWSFEKAITTPIGLGHVRLIEYMGESKTLMQWCKELDLVYHLILWRFNHGMLFEVAIKLDMLSIKGSIEINGVTKTLLEWCKDANIHFNIFKNRLYKGWTFQEALSDIASKQITFNPCNDDKPPDTQTLEFWCGLLGLDKDVTYLRMLRGESFENIVAE